MPSIAANFPRTPHSWRVFTVRGERGAAAFLSYEDSSGISAIEIRVLDQGEAQDLLEAVRTAVEQLRAADQGPGPE